jgi:hypothetical protein
LLTSDATSIYTNIDTDEGIHVLHLYLGKYESEGKESRTGYGKNVFQFGNSFWKQNVGTAIGMQCTCIYTALFFPWVKREQILTKYKTIWCFIVTALMTFLESSIIINIILTNGMSSEYI